MSDAYNFGGDAWQSYDPTQGYAPPGSSPFGPDAYGEVASIRNNNPGAMWWKGNKYAQKWGATGGQNLNDGLNQGNNIATFPSPEAGIAAHFDMLSGPGYSGRTVGSAMQKWTGGNGGSAYVRGLGIDPNTVITPEFLNSDAGMKFVQAQAHMEAGKQTPWTQDQWQTGQRMAFNGQPPNQLPDGGTRPPGGLSQTATAPPSDYTLAPQFQQQPSQPGGRMADNSNGSPFGGGGSSQDAINSLIQQANQPQQTDMGTRLAMAGAFLQSAGAQPWGKTTDPASIIAAGQRATQAHQQNLLHIATILQSQQNHQDELARQGILTQLAIQRGNISDLNAGQKDIYGKPQGAPSAAPIFTPPGGAAPQGPGAQPQGGQPQPGSNPIFTPPQAGSDQSDLDTANQMSDEQALAAGITPNAYPQQLPTPPPSVGAYGSAQPLPTPTPDASMFSPTSMYGSAPLSGGGGSAIQAVQAAQAQPAQAQPQGGQQQSRPAPQRNQSTQGTGLPSEADFDQAADGIRTYLANGGDVTKAYQQLSPALQREVDQWHDGGYDPNATNRKYDPSVRMAGKLATALYGEKTIQEAWATTQQHNDAWKKANDPNVTGSVENKLQAMDNVVSNLFTGNGENQPLTGLYDKLGNKQLNSTPLSYGVGVHLPEAMGGAFVGIPGINSHYGQTGDYVPAFNSASQRYMQEATKLRLTGNSNGTAEERGGPQAYSNAPNGQAPMTTFNSQMQPNEFRNSVITEMGQNIQDLKNMRQKAIESVGGVVDPQTGAVSGTSYGKAMGDRIDKRINEAQGHLNDWLKDHPEQQSDKQKGDTASGPARTGFNPPTTPMGILNALTKRYW